jgi:hypothetical protein
MVVNVGSFATAIITDVPDTVERHVKQMSDYVLQAIAFVGHMASEHPNEFITAFSTTGIFIFTWVLARSTKKLWKATQVASAQQSRDTEQSIAVSRIAADSATRSAETAERALIAGQRAFVSVVFNQSANRDVTSGHITGWRFVPHWMNTGNTPTRNMLNHVSMAWPTSALPDNWHFPDYWNRGAPRLLAPLCAAPHATVEGQDIVVPVDIIADVIAGHKFLYFWGWATYDDVFPTTNRHVTRFAVRIVIGGDARNSDRISFAYRHLGQYNCSDEECERQGFPADWRAPEAEVN